METKTGIKRRLVNKIESSYPNTQPPANKIGNYKPPEQDKTAKRSENVGNSDAKRRGNRESYEDAEEMDLDLNMPNEELRDNNERSNQPHVPLLSLGRIADKDQMN